MNYIDNPIGPSTAKARHSLEMGAGSSPAPQESMTDLTLVVSQLDPDGVEATEIGRYAITPATWGQLQRTFPERLPSDTPDSVWLDIYEGDDLRDETIIVAHHHGVWLLRDWMKPPSSRWKRIRTPNG